MSVPGLRCAICNCTRGIAGCSRAINTPLGGKAIRYSAILMLDLSSSSDSICSRFLLVYRLSPCGEASSISRIMEASKSLSYQLSRSATKSMMQGALITESPLLS